jgi:hypothetical protein
MNGSKAGTFANALALAVAAATLTQVIHESTHALTALAFGSGDIFLQLFAVSHDGSGLSAGANALIAGSAALVNILLGALGVWWFRRERRALARLFTFYVAVFSLFSGFGYLMVDALLYNPANRLGDYQAVIHFFGGIWPVRGSFLLLGAGGVLWTFFFVPRAAVRFADDATDPASRHAMALPVLLAPYFVVCGLFLALSANHPVGELGFWVVFAHYVFGYFGVMWGYFWATFWTTPAQKPVDATPLPGGLNAAATVGGLAVTVVLLVWFNAGFAL